MYLIDRNIKTRVKILRAQIRELKSTLFCDICKENHYACLQFHHVDPDEKEIAISLAASLGWSFNRIKQEISKCRVLCANCHFKLHYDEKQERE